MVKITDNPFRRLATDIWYKKRKQEQAIFNHNGSLIPSMLYRNVTYSSAIFCNQSIDSAGKSNFQIDFFLTFTD